MGGEKGTQGLKGQAWEGSPPHGRGKVPAVLQCRRFRGITPALAGKSREIPLHLRAAKDHPRVGGEKQIGGDNGLDKQGSPPRGRGKGPGIQDIVTFRRITPAWAGKSDRRRPSPPGGWDHPRVGGEKLFLVLLGEQRVGSPPRGRGKVAQRVCNVGAGGITPAWAGKRPSPRP